MTFSYTVRIAQLVDVNAVCNLVVQNWQSLQDVLAPETCYWIVEVANHTIVGTVGLEFGGQAKGSRAPVFYQLGVVRALGRI